MNHLIFSAVLTACLGIGGHQYNQPHGPFNNSSGKYFYKELGQLNSSNQYYWSMLILPHSAHSVAIYTCMYYLLTYFAGNFEQYNIHTKALGELPRPEQGYSEEPLPCPHAEDLSYQLSGTNIFYKVDLRDAANKIFIKSEDGWKNTLKARKCLFGSLLMLFVLCNTPSTSQTMVDVVLGDLKDQCHVV
ncbi:hypothetical protein DSO57_1027661 [Entomophthora muscae]|uniref:Uncharacterized protein n=1 Tax=Entomophthora muscae TaxID=34485 RepID=A0ACC2UAR2_9FUNG|nr:hypothetical protein DSO57_1027661 [Entomophthora muscae]